MPALPFPFPIGGYEANDGGAGGSGLGSARPIVSETKLVIAAEMERAGHPVTSEEMCEALEDAVPLAAIEYHLSTLVSAGAAKALSGPNVYFQLVSQGTVPLALTESKSAPGDSARQGSNKQRGEMN